MGKEILAVPEDYLEDVIFIIRRGIHWIDYHKEGDHIPKVVREQLDKWCDEEEEYLDRLYRNNLEEL